MKIKKVASKTTRTVTLRVDNKVMLKIDNIAKKNKLSRQKLIEAILKKAISNKNFEVEVEG